MSAKCCLRNDEARIYFRIFSEIIGNRDKIVTARIRERMSEIGSRSRASWSDLAGWFDNGSKLGEVSLTFARFVIASRIALHARLTICGKQLV